MTTYNEEQIQARHRERVSALVDLFGSTHLIPRDLINRLQERNKEDWVQFVAERDGKAKSELNAPLMPPVTDEEVAALIEPSTSEEPDEAPVVAETPARVPPTSEDIADPQTDGRDSRYVKDHPEQF
jgi:hypothetical protein